MSILLPLDRLPTTAGEAAQSLPSALSMQPLGVIMKKFMAIYIDAAARLFVNHPHFTILPGDSVEIMECLPMPGRG